MLRSRTRALTTNRLCFIVFVVSAVSPVLVAGTGVAAAQSSAAVVIVDVAKNRDQSTNAIETLRAKLPELGLVAVNDRRIRDALEGEFPRATNHLKVARQKLDDAGKSFSNFEFEAAIAHLELAQTSATRALAAPGDGDASLKLLAEVHLVWGRVREADGKSDAIEHFRCSARLDPKRTELDPGAFKPSVAQLYKLARKTAWVGRSEIEVGVRQGDSATGATTQLNGRSIGSLPARAEGLSPGIHYLLTRADNATSDARVITLSGKQSITVALNRQTDNDRLASARRGLAINPSKLDARSAQTIAEIANADVVVVVRDGKDGAEAATFQRNRETSSAWMAVAALTFQANREVSRPVASTLDDDTGDASGVAIENGQANEAASPWYLTWKGAAVLAVVVAVAAVAAVILIPNDTSFEIGGPCNVACRN